MGQWIKKIKTLVSAQCDTEKKIMGLKDGRLCQTLEHMCPTYPEVSQSSSKTVSQQKLTYINTAYSSRHTPSNLAHSSPGLIVEQIYKFICALHIVYFSSFSTLVTCVKQLQIANSYRSFTQKNPKKHKTLIFDFPGTF